MQRQWKDITETDGRYEVSNWGEVRRTIDNEVLEQREVIGGYLSVALVIEGKTNHRRIHRLVLEAFVGACPDDYGPHFEDGNRKNCELSNLRWKPKNKGEGGRSKTEVGDEVGEFQAVANVGCPAKSHSVHWRIRCLRCDAEYVVTGQAFRSGMCKCDQCDYPLFDQPTTEKDVLTKPTKDVREYKKWLDMKNRCKNRTEYTAKGIVVCDEWMDDFLKFFRDVGPQPGPDYSVDRWPNREGNYEPSNVRWATKRQQNENRSW